MKRTKIVAAGITAAVLVLSGASLVASAQNGADAKSGSNAPQAGTQNKSAQSQSTGTAGENANPQSAASKEKLRSELNNLLRQRATLERKIDEARRKLGENSDGERIAGQNGASHHRFEFRNGDGQPQVFEFDGDGTGNLPPEARKQIEEAQKRMRDAFGAMQFENFPDFQFRFDRPNGQGGFDGRSLRDMMEKMRQEMRDRGIQPPIGKPGTAPNAKPDDSKPGKGANSKVKTFDV